MESEISFLQQIDFFNSKARTIVKSYVDEMMVGINLPKKQFEDFKYYQGLWLKAGGKELNQ